MQSTDDKFSLRLPALYPAARSDASCVLVTGHQEGSAAAGAPGSQVRQQRTSLHLLPLRLEGGLLGLLSLCKDLEVWQKTGSELGVMAGLHSALAGWSILSVLTMAVGRGG